MNKKEDSLTPPKIEIHMFDSLYLGNDCRYRWKQKDAFGPYWRIYWNEGPGGFVKVGNHEVELTSDKIVVLSPDTVYSTWLENKVKHFYVHCSVGKPFSMVKPNLFELKNRELLEMAKDAAQTVSDHAISDHNDYRTLMKLHMYVSAILLALPPKHIPINTKYDPRISQAITIIGNSRKKSNQGIAEILNMSTNGFLRLFKNETGITPQVYSRKKRLNDARIMLHFSSSTIENIAEETGFCSRYHFTRVFRQEFNIGPGQFRSKNQIKM
jgi:AraC-like DNA-binding protein